MRGRRAPLIVLAALAAACSTAGPKGQDLGAGLDAAADAGPPVSDGGAGDQGPAADSGGPPDLAPPDPAALLASRPYALKVPSGYQPSSSAPLLVMLHGYGSSGDEHERYFKLGPVAEAAGALYATPDGTFDLLGKRGWNATDGCCIFQPQKPDDLAYLTALIDDVQARYTIDPKRIFVVGHSNGGFMTHRLACELSGRIAAVVSLAGGQWKDPAKCVAPNGTAPVSVLQIHADTDDTIQYDGGQLFFLAPPYPSAHETVATWAGKIGCAGALTSGVARDLVGAVAGAETTVDAYAGCPAGRAVELWTVTGLQPSAAHQPAFAPGFAETIWAFLAAHPKP